MNQPHRVSALIKKLEAFLDHTNGPAWSMNAAKDIEGTIRELFEDDDEVMELADDFAQYRPNGGDYLYSYTEMKPKVAYALKRLMGTK